MNLHWQKIPIQNSIDWVSALKEIPHSYFHTWDFNIAMCRYFQRPIYLYTSKLENSFICVPVLERVFNGYVDYVTPHAYAGLLTSNCNQKHLDAFSQMLKEQDVVCSCLALNPILSEDGLFASTVFFQRNSSFYIDLRLPEENLIQNMSHGKRSAIHLPKGAKFIEDRNQLIEAFINLYTITMQRTFAKETCIIDELTLRRLCDISQSYLLGVEVDGQIVVVILSGWTTDVADYVYNGSTDEGRSFTTALLWKSLMHFKAMGIPFYHLGGGMKEDDGVTRFKSLIGGERLKFGYLKLIHNQEIYERLCKAANVDPDNKSGWFPPYRFT